MRTCGAPNDAWKCKLLGLGRYRYRNRYRYRLLLSRQQPIAIAIPIPIANSFDHHFIFEAVPHAPGGAPNDA